MDRKSPRWHQVTPSEYPWEQEALDHVRELLPDRDPVEAWANFEFITDHGQVYEVDLLVVTPKGLFLVEIKSRPGALEGDGGTWTWKTDGRSHVRDNPLLLANRKAKTLKSLLERQKAVRSARGRLPYLQPMIFLSADKLTSRLTPDGVHHVYGRDGLDQASLPSIKDGLLQIDPERFARHGRPVDRPIGSMVARAIEQAGIRPSNRQRMVGDYALGDLIDDGPVSQDFVGIHRTLADYRRRVRVYGVAPDADDALRQTVERAAEREFRTLQSLTHSSILPVHEFAHSNLGPALLFRYNPSAVRLDRFLVERRASLGMDARLSLMRQIAEALAYAHDRHVVHRALSPSAVEVVDPDATFPHVQVLNWQMSATDEQASQDAPVSGTLHVDRLVEQGDSAYMAPEVFGVKEGVEQADVFSLGALAFLIFSGTPPATSLSELQRVLHDNQGLAIETVLDGAGAALSRMIRQATHPEVSQRTPSVADFLSDLTAFEDELTAPDEEERADPTSATKGDLLAPGLTVASRLGQGSSSVVFQIVEYPADQVLKVALDVDQNPRILDEWEVLSKLRHPNVVTVAESTMDVADRQAIRMQRAGDRTLAQRLRDEGPLSLDLLRRFGDELLAVVDYLDGEGIAHRDIKPANLGVSSPRGKDELRLILFDFSLSRASRDAIHAGTPPYLEPFLVHRTPPRWDEAAERYAAAVTLYEMATGQLPRWGDGQSDPAALTCEVTIDQEVFEPALAHALADFFGTALARDPLHRHPSARAMRDAWQGVFHQAETPSPGEDGPDRVALNAAQLDTALRALDLSVVALDVLERASVYTVQDLLATPFNEIAMRRGVGNRVKREIGTLLRDLRALGLDIADTPTDDGESGERSIDSLVARLLPKRTKKNEVDVELLAAVLGLQADNDAAWWPGLTDVAGLAGRPRAEVTRVLGTARERWRRSPSMSALAAEVVQVVETHEGVLSVGELASSLLALRGSVASGGERDRRARAVVRAIVEMEQGRGSALAEQRIGDEVFLTADRDAGATEMFGYIAELGQAADEIASSDPLMAPAAVRDQLDGVSRPASLNPFSESRLVRIAAAASSSAAASSRLELYPRGMEPARALRLARTALLGPETLTRDDLAARVRARFPLAQRLPDRPALDALLTDAGLGFSWDGARGAYLAPRALLNRATSHTSFGRVGTGHIAAADDGVEEARRFEERLVGLTDRGGFLALSVLPRKLGLAEQQLRHLPVARLDVERTLLAAMRSVAAEKNVNWALVLQSDREPDSGDWHNLLKLVRLAMPRVRDAVLAAEGVTLLTRLGLLGRYEQIGLIEELRDLVVAGQAGTLTGLWVLATTSDEGGMPTIDGHAVPVLTPDQWATVPDAWLRNLHRAAMASQ